MSVGAEARINLSKASILILESSQHALDTLGQICKGFDTGNLHRCLTVEEADTVIRSKSVDLVIIDPSVEAGAGFGFVRTLRASGGERTCSLPIIALCGHPTITDVGRCRDTGASFVLAKPITPAGLLSRLQSVARDQRPIVSGGDYIGPDRRFKFEGPPPGTAGRRQGDKDVSLGEAQEPNMSQSDINALVKPQRVSL